MTAEELRQRLQQVQEPLQRSTSSPQMKPWPLLIFAFVALYFWSSIWLLPLRLLVVTFHELGHAVVTLLTGGQVLSIAVSADEGGLTQSLGGWPLLILNGGYLGSLFFGMLLLALAKKEGRGRLLCFFLGFSLLTVAWLWVPLLSFGFLYVTLAALGFLYASRRASHGLADLGVRAIGLFSVFYALFDIRSDVFSGTGVSDAVMLAQRTGVPALFWGVGWVLLSLGLLWKLRRRLI